MVGCSVRRLVREGAKRGLVNKSELAIKCLSARSSSTSAQAIPSAKREVKSFDEVPGPPMYPLIGNMLGVRNPEHGMDPRFVIKSMRHLNQEHGSMVRIQVPLRPPMVFLFDPALCEKVYRSTGPQPVRPGFDSLSFVQTKMRKRHGHRGLLVAQKEEWRQFRSKVQQPMLRPKSTHGYIPVLERIAEDFLAAKVIALRDSGGMVPEDFLQELYKWALESVAVLALNTRLGCLEPDLPKGSEQETLIKAVGNMFLLNGKLDDGMQLWRYMPIQGPAMRKFEATCQVFFDICERHIERAMEDLETRTREEGEDKTLLELFKERGCDTGTATIMALDMLFAGIDTSSHTIAFALYHLAKNPRVQDRLHEEVKASLGPSGTLKKNAFDSLPYLKAVIKETLRFGSPASANARVLEQDLEVGGHILPTGTVAVLCHMTMQHNPEFINNPEVFLPERWMKSEKEYQAVHPFVSLPFGQGTRMCVGKRFAELEVFILLSKIVQRFRVSWPHKDLGMETRTLTIPDAPLRLVFQDRSILDNIRPQVQVQ